MNKLFNAIELAQHRREMTKRHGQRVKEDLKKTAFKLFTTGRMDVLAYVKFCRKNNVLSI